MAKIIEIIVDEDDNIEIKTTGFSGAECKSATKELQRTLGVTVSDTVTSEFYQRQTQGQQNRINLGGK